MTSRAAVPELQKAHGSPWVSVGKPFAQLRKFWASALPLLLVTAAYYAGTAVGFLLTPAQEKISIFWPPNAILLATLLLAPRRKWWMFILAVLPPHLLIQLRAHVPLLTAMGWFFTNSGEALLGAYLIRRVGGDARTWFDTVKGLIIFFAYGVFVAPLMTSFIDAAVVVSTGWGEHYWLLWTTRLFSNMLGELALVPTIVIFAVKGRSWLKHAGIGRQLEALALVLSIVVMSVIAFGGQGTGRIHLPTFFYMPLPLLLWASLRFGSAGVSSSLLITALMSGWYAVHGQGPFNSPAMIENVLSLQVLLAMITFPLMLLSAVLSERKVTEQSLRESRGRLIDTQEQERRRIACELHDDLGQRLALVESEISQLRDECEPSVRPRLDDIRNQLSEASKSTREISHGLHPPHLEQLGLETALRKLCRDFSHNTTLEVQLAQGTLPDHLDSHVSLSLYRVVQEALHNVEKHSHAHHVEIQLNAKAGSLHLHIADDGSGFASEEVTQIGLGMANMKERVVAIGGTISISSTPMKGTRIDVSVPFKSVV